MATPSQKLTDPHFNYRNSAQTDVTQTWRRFGWKPVEEQRQQPVAEKKQ